MDTSQIETLTELLLSRHDELPWTGEIDQILPAAVRELAHGEPVAVERVAARAGLPGAQVLEFLQRSAGEFDGDGFLVGFGLTLRPTRHRLDLDGHAMYTWCAPDALAFPILLGKAARIHSPCFSTGEIVQVDIDPSGVRALDPQAAVVSMVRPDIGLPELRCRVCDEQHFFSSAAAASEWQAERPEAMILSVRDAFAVTRALASRWLS